jgi:hypothetical protein
MPLVDPLRSFDGIVRKISVAGASTGPLGARPSSPRTSTTCRGIPRARAIPTGNEPTESPGRRGRPSEELAANRVKDRTLGSVASLPGAPQVSIPVVTESYAIGHGLPAAPGHDARLLALAELLAS